MFERFRHKKESSAEEGYRKHKESGQQMVEFARRSETFSADQIIGELEKMHNSSGVALWPERGGLFYKVLERVSQRGPSKEEISRLLNMLAWPEFARFRDRENAQKVLRIASQVPSREFLPALQQHLDWLEGTRLQFKSRSEIESLEATQSMAAHEISGYTPIPYGADETRFQGGIEEEIRLTNELITKCGQ